MKTKTTMKSIRNNWRNIYQCDYCKLQNIMYGREPNYYTSGVYGWNCDVYCDNVAITTGYRGMTGKHISTEIIKKHDDIAKEIISSNIPYKEIEQKLATNRQDFFKALMEV